MEVDTDWKLLKTEKKGVTIRMLAIFIPIVCVLLVIISLNNEIVSLNSEEEALMFIISSPYLYVAILLIITSVVMGIVVNKINYVVSLTIIIICITITTVLFIYSLY